MTPQRLTDKELGMLFLVNTGLDERAFVEMTSAKLVLGPAGEVDWSYQSKLTALLMAASYTSVN